MIFVTVGTASFDTLIAEIDRLVGEGVIRDRVVAQIGRGSYLPKNFRFFRLVKSLQKAYDQAEVVVSAGGAGTTMECVKRGLRLVVVENTSLMEGHQAQLIQEMSRRGHLVWCKSLPELADCIRLAREARFRAFVSDPPRVHKLIMDLLERE